MTIYAQVPPAASPVVAHRMPTPSAERAEPAVVAGQAGETLVSRAPTGAVTLSVDPGRRDGRLSIRMAAANLGASPAAFGPESITVTARGRTFRVATADELVGPVIGRSQRDSALARASAAPTISGFGTRDTTQDDTPSDATSGVPGERFARGDRIDGSYEARDRELVRLRAALLGPIEVPARESRTGAVLTERLPGGVRSVDVAVSFAGTTHRFSVETTR